MVRQKLKTVMYKISAPKIPVCNIMGPESITNTFSQMNVQKREESLHLVRKLEGMSSQPNRQLSKQLEMSDLCSSESSLSQEHSPHRPESEHTLTGCTVDMHKHPAWRSTSLYYSSYVNSGQTHGQHSLPYYKILLIL